MTVKPLLLALSILVTSPPVAAAAEPCRDEAPEPIPVRLSGLDAAGDPLLADGRTLRLVGLAPRQDAAGEARFRAGLEAFVGRDLLIALAGEKDRWGRWPARLFVAAAPAGADQDVAALLQASGAALPMPEGGTASCAPAKTVAAAKPAVAPQVLTSAAIDGHDPAAVKQQEGRYVAIEGRVASVGERPQRTYLNFSRRPAEAASIVVPRKLWRELQDAGWTAAGLGGKRLRAYGVLGGRNGLLLEVTSRAALELID